jgi:hypothetical protein
VDGTCLGLIALLTIKVLGPGCSNCKKLEAIAKQSAELMKVQAEFVKVTDYAEITKYPVLSTPGLVINDKVVSSGAEGAFFIWNIRR